MNRNTASLTAIALSLVVFLSGCEVIGGIFKAGVWSGIIIVVVVLAIVFYIVAKLSSKK